MQNQLSPYLALSLFYHLLFYLIIIQDGMLLSMAQKNLQAFVLKKGGKGIKLVLEKKISIADVDDEYKVGTHIINAVKGYCTCLTFM